MATFTKNGVLVTNIYDLIPGQVAHRGYVTLEELTAPAPLNGYRGPSIESLVTRPSTEKRIGFDFAVSGKVLPAEVAKVTPEAKPELTHSSLLEIAIKRYRCLLTQKAITEIAREYGMPRVRVKRMLTKAVIDDPTKVAFTEAKDGLAFWVRKPGPGRAPKAIREQVEFLRSRGDKIALRKK